MGQLHLPCNSVLCAKGNFFDDVDYGNEDDDGDNDALKSKFKK